jgi:hypothetical protein
MRRERGIAVARLAVLEMVGHSLGFIHGPRTRGPKPHGMDKAEPELEALFQKLATARAKYGS